MSRKEDRYASISAGLGEVLDKIEPRTNEVAAPRTAPGQLIAFRNEMLAYEEKIAALESRVKDLQSSAVDVASISPNPWQPRRVFDEVEIQKLAGSIAEIGLIQPIIIRSVSIADTPADKQSVSIADTQYQLIAGERRLRAHKLLGIADIKAIVVVASDEEMATLALAENVDREDLTAYEVALAIRNAESAFPNRKSLASCLGINRTELYQFLAFFKLPDFVVNDLEITPGLLGRHAAEDIAKVVSKHADKATEALRHIWPRVKTGEIDQGKIASLIETSVTRGEYVRAERDIRKLFVGKEQAGSITRDTSGLTIKIRSAALTPDKENELRQFVEGMFKNGG